MSRRGRSLVLGAVLLAALAPATARADPPFMSRDDLICRGNSAVGFSYWWGGACWCANGCNHDWGCSSGGCAGNCPDCNHWGGYGADCSGFVTRVWQVPNPISLTTCNHGPYVANSYKSESVYWDVISRTDVQPADALASSTHIFLFHYGDPWGTMMAYEARGCSYGIVHNNRTASSAYSAARRINISSCQCSPGDVQADGCGSCGQRTRTCAGSCTWGDWGSCQGQGECTPGAVQIADCCDCGSQSRSCGGSCAWSAWSACTGPDPGGGTELCDTGEPGPCAEGRTRCQGGCLACVRVYAPRPEVCDGLDNDCVGGADDGNPTVMGETRPDHAASRRDVAYPGLLAPGETAWAWVDLVNEGTATWRPRDLWLTAVPAVAGEPSPLRWPDEWPAWDVAAVLEDEVPPGSATRVLVPIQAPEDGRSRVQATFRLAGPDGVPLACPTPEATLDIRIAEPLASAAPTALRPPADPPSPARVTSGCATGGTSTGAPLLALALLALGRWRRRR